MSRFKEAHKDSESGKKNPKMAQKRKKKEAENYKDNRVMSKERLPLIGSSGNRSAVRPSISTPHPPPQDSRKRGPPLISTGAPDYMAPWEGSSHSESSFTSFPPAPSPLPLTHSKPVTAPDPPPAPPPAPPPQPSNPQPDSGHSTRVKRRPIVPRHPARPPRLPPLRQISNLSFSRSFTFSFFELPVHQSARSRAERLRDLTLLLRQFRY